MGFTARSELAWLAISTVFGTVLLPHASGMLPSFDEALDTYIDDDPNGAQTHTVDVSSSTPDLFLQIFRVPATHFKCSDEGYCLCGTTDQLTAILAKTSATGQLISAPDTDCIIAPYIRPAVDQRDCWDGTPATSGSYVGKVSLTHDFIPCQAWASQDPKTHDYTDDDFLLLDGSLAAAENYCRDPGGCDGRPWCYRNVYTGYEWDYCDTECNDDEYRMAMREVSSTDQPGDIEEINTEVNRALQQEYGSWNATNGLVVTWKMSDGQNPAGENIFQAVIATDLHRTYVLYFYDILESSTNPAGGDNIRGYLFDGVDNTARICNFESDYDSPLSDANLPLYSNRQCGNPGVYVFETFMDVFPIDPPLSPAGEICWDGLYADQYTGHVAVTASGITCQAWASQTPHVHATNDQDSHFPDGTVAAASNYCRDPPDGVGVPWCYTTDPGTRWELCDVLCPAGCWNGVDPRQYAGRVSRTKSGITCQAWNSNSPHDHTGQADADADFPLDPSVAGAKNYCRDPEGYGYLWCFTTDPNTTWEKCDVITCEETESVCPFSGAATSCSTSFTTTNPSCNVTSKPRDSCTVSYFCSRNESDPNIAHLTISFMWYKYPWVQAMKTATYMGSGPTPDGIQEFVQGDPVGSCSGMLSNPNTPGNNDSVVLTLSMNPADSEAKRCGFNVNNATGTIEFVVKRFDWDGVTAPVGSFGPNSPFDQAGDLVVYGRCIVDEYPVKPDAEANFNDIETVPVTPSPRTLALEVVNLVSDTDAIQMEVCDAGKIYYLRICLDRGSSLLDNGEPFGIYATSCDVSNDATFPASASPLYTSQFIANSCPTTNTGPVTITKAFTAPSNYYGSSKPNPWCIYTSSIVARRYNTHAGAPLALLNKLYFRCHVHRCITQDGLSPADHSTEEQLCYDSCLADNRRRRRSTSNATIIPPESVFTSLTIRDPEGKADSQKECTRPAIAMATIGVLIALLTIFTVLCVVIFIKLMKLLARAPAKKT